MTPQLQVMSLLVDGMMDVIPEKSVRIGATKAHMSYRETEATLFFSRQSPEVLQIIAKKFTGQPLRLQQADINVKNGLLTGTINLTIIGS